MKGKMKRLLAVALSIMLVLPLQMFGGVTARADELHGYITVVKDTCQVYLYNNSGNIISEPDLDYCGKAYSGISFNAQSKTLTLQNVNIPNDSLCIDIHDDVEIKVNLVGTNKIRSIDGHCDLNFTGSGSLSFEDMLNMVGKITFSDSTVVSAYGVATSALSIGPNATLTIKQPNPSFKDSFDPDAPENCLIDFTYAYDSKGTKSTDGLLKYDGNISEAVKWSIKERLTNGDDRQISETESISYYKNDFDPKDKILKNLTDGDFYIFTYHGIGTSVYSSNPEGIYEFTKIDYDEASDTWRESANDADTVDNVLEDNTVNIDFTNNFIQYSDENASDFPPSISSNSTINMYIRTNQPLPGSQVYKKDGKKYQHVKNVSFNPNYPVDADNYNMVCEIASINNFKYLIPVERAISMPNGYEISKIDDPNFIPQYSYTKYVVNNTLVFSPKSNENSSATSTTTQATVNGAAYTVTVDTNGKATAEYDKPQNSKVKKATVPETIDTAAGKVPVTSIASNAFANCKDLTSVTMPKSIEEIGSGAFQNCSKLTTVNIPAATKKIGKNAFKNCKAMKSVKFKGNNVETIESGAFSGCKKLTNVTVTKNVKSIKANAFAGTGKLTKVTIKSKSVKIAKNAFKGHKNTKVYIPKKLKGKAKTNFVKMLTKAGFKKKNIKAK